MAEPAISASALHKTFGDVRALNGLDLEVASGEVFGFIGPNGAGKSTTIRILMDLLRPTAGDVRVLGTDPSLGGPALRARIGYLPGELHVNGRGTAGAMLAYLARLRGGRGVERIPHLADLLALDLDRPVRGLHAPRFRFRRHSHLSNLVSLPLRECAAPALDAAGRPFCHGPRARLRPAAHQTLPRSPVHGQLRP